jgi:soluble lytic murein transglycosylase-like protein/rubrerythrin
MASILELRDLDLRGAFDFAIMIEEEAQSRYARLGRLLGGDPGGAGEVFRRMAATEAEHRGALAARRDALFAGEPPRVDVSVLDAGVEAPEAGDDDDLPRTARAALELAVAAERRAWRFYADVLPTVANPGVRSFFERLRDDEERHAALLQRELDALGAGPEPAPAPAPAPAEPAADWPDRAALATQIPRFDAATQLIADAVLVGGRAPREVAEALGVSRRTVALKLSRFVALARQHAAIALAAATVAGCAGPAAAPSPPAGRADARPAEARAVARVVADRVDRVLERANEHHRDDRGALASAVHEQVAARMKRADPAVHRRVSRAILTEARLVGLDPLLVLALIHVESSFDPHAQSNAGAVGLMQLLEPTMRREVERSGLDSADRRDPVANVRAGTRYLRRLVDAFAGDLDTALMAYNAGPNRIRGHLRRGEIPERFHVYPQKVRRELRRLHVAVAPAAGEDAALAKRDEPAAREAAAGRGAAAAGGVRSRST